MSSERSRGWTAERLGDHVGLLVGFPFKSAEYTDDPGGVRLLRGDNVGQGRLRWDGARRWPDEMRSPFDRYELLPGDIVLAMDRPWIDAGLKYGAVRKEDLPCLLVQRVARLRGGTTLAQQYLRYLIGSPRFTSYVRAIQTGTAVPHISGQQIADFRFELPPRPEQERIADLLGALDDKIDSNRRLAALLHGMVAAVFRARFVDFVGIEEFEDSEIGRIPRGWEIGPLTELMDFLAGGTPRTSIDGYWGGDVAWISVKDTVPGPYVIKTERSVTERALAETRLERYPANTVVITARGTVGNVALMADSMTLNQSCYAVRGREGIGQLYAFFVLRQAVDTLRARSHGSVFSTITRDTFRSITVTHPPPLTLAVFERDAGAPFSLIRGLEHEATTLGSIRDALLPKLISGQIQVPATNDANEAIGPVMEQIAGGTP